MALGRLIGGFLAVKRIPNTVHRISVYGFRLTSSSTAETQSSDTTEGLGARLGFIVEELENLQKEKAEKSAAFEKLRAWRERRSLPQSAANAIHRGDKEQESKKNQSHVAEDQSVNVKSSSASVPAPSSKNEIVHPWPEWIELMERLVQQHYFDNRKGDEDNVTEDVSGEKCDHENEKIDVLRDLSSVRQACLDLGKDRFDILKNLTRRDIQILVGYGCPNLDRKVVYSAKRLRAYVRLDEGDVCSSCEFRSRCELAYILPRDLGPAQTMDVMRILTVYGLDPLINSVENKLHKRKLVKASICKLLAEVVALTAFPIDPNLPKPVIEKPPPKVKQPPPPPRPRVGRDDIEMKKGDWVCSKCDFMNFAKNHNCLQCGAKRPKRDLNPGEWECPKCNFLNYRRNMTCYSCDFERPEDEYTKSRRNGEDLRQAEGFQGSRVPISRLESDTMSKFWNDDFDDGESDGAEVATFEYANISRLTDGSYDFEPHDDDDSQVNENRKRDSGALQRHKRGEKPLGVKMESFQPADKEMSAFNDFGDFDGDKVETYRRDGHRTNNKGISSENDCFAYPSRRHSEKFQRHPPFGSKRIKKKRDIAFDEDDGESSFDSDEETGWERDRKSKFKGRKDDGIWSRRVTSVYHRPGYQEPNEEAPRFPGNDMKGNGFRGFDRKMPYRGKGAFSKNSENGFNVRGRFYGRFNRHQGGNRERHRDGSFRGP